MALLAGLDYYTGMIRKLHHLTKMEAEAVIRTLNIIQVVYNVWKHPYLLFSADKET